MFSRRSERPAKPASRPSAPAVASALARATGCEWAIFLHWERGSGGFTLYITPVLYLYTESAQALDQSCPGRIITLQLDDRYY